MNSGIYKIENIINHKIYIGSSINLKSREYKHFWMLNKNIHDNNYLQHSFNKFGEKLFIFSILEKCEQKSLIEKENYYINEYKYIYIRLFLTILAILYFFDALSSTLILVDENNKLYNYLYNITFEGSFYFQNLQGLLAMYILYLLIFR